MKMSSAYWSLSPQLFLSSELKEKRIDDKAYP
jgi:hypothetical protein